MKATFWFNLLSVVSAVAAVVLSLNPSAEAASDDAEARKQMNEAFQQGNFKDAYEGFRKLVLDPQDDSRQVGGDLSMAIQCLGRLNRIAECDALLEDAVKVHKDNWRLLAAAAQQYMNDPHWGFIVAGKFERGQQRGGGNMVNAVERDRVLAPPVDGPGHALGDEGREPRRGRHLPAIIGRHVAE